MKKTTWSGSLTIRRLPEGPHKNWVLASTLAATVYRSSATTIRLSPGLFTDGASIGRLFWTVIGCPLGGKYAAPAVIHDALYAAHITTRKEADKIFQFLMLDAGVSAWRATLMYAAVRAAGNRAWDSHNLEENARVAKLVSCDTYNW